MFSLDNLPIATNSHWNKAVHTLRFGESPQIQFIPLGLDESTFKPVDKQKARQKLGLTTNDNTTIILTGSCNFNSRGKGGQDLLKVFDELSNREDILFVYMGSSEKASLPNNVRALGYLSSPTDIATAYNSADIFLNPVLVEAFGQTMLEASACGVPIVSYSTTGTTNISIHNFNALHAKTSDTKDLINKIDTLIKDPMLRSRLGSNGRLLTEKFFTLRKQYANWRRFIIDISYINQNTNCSDDCRRLSRIGAYASSRQNNSNAEPPKKPVFTILTPTYNVGNEFYRTANSILEQSHVGIEWIVFDGLSKSHTSENILRECKNLISKLIREKDNGIYDALNKCAPHISGEYVLVMGSRLPY